MRHISRILIVAALAITTQSTVAQPPSRNNGNAKNAGNKETPGMVEMSERAKLQYPVAQAPQEVAWRRDIYRTISLEDEKNASLYYPVEPMGNNVNLFTCLFHNILKGNITAYKYNLDGVESFTDANIIKPLEILENYSIYYEMKDGQYVVGNSDVPSAEALSYYIKESHYYDQRTGTYGKQVTAICPVLHRSDDYGVGVTKYPMFWLKYDDISALLAMQPLMTSSINNVMSTTMDDFFRNGYYKGEIYKTLNTRNLAITQYCKDSAEIKKEQEKIEQQLSDFRTNLWNTKTVAEMRQDSIKAANEAESANSKTKKTTGRTGVKRTTTSRSSTAKSSTTTKSSSTTKKTSTAKTSQPKKEKSSGSSGSANVSVRRTRR